MKNKAMAIGIAMLVAILPVVLGLLIFLGGRYKRVEEFLKRCKAFLERRKL